MVGVWASLLAAFVDAPTRAPITEMATRLGVNGARPVALTGTAGRIAWLRRMGTPEPVLLRILDALAELGIDPTSTRPSTLDPWLSWYAWALQQCDPMTWGGTATLAEMADWAVATERALAPPLTLAAASAGSRAWHRDTGDSEKWDRWASRVRAWVREGRRPPEGEVLLRWPDGVTLSKLRSSDLAEEGEIMGHCVGSYTGAVSSGASSIYSVRNADGFPVVTLEAKSVFTRQSTPSGMAFSQVKGPGNSPVLARWAPYVREAWRKANEAWLEAFEAKMKAALEAGKLRDLGVETWRDAATGWSMVEVPPERVEDLVLWMGIEGHGQRADSGLRWFALLDPQGIPQAALVDQTYTSITTVYPAGIYGPGLMEPSPEAKDAYLSWWVPKFRGEGLRPYPMRGRSGADLPVMNQHSDGVFRLSLSRRTSDSSVTQVLPADSTLLWMHRGHPLFELAILPDVVSAFAFARFVDQGSMPDTVAVFEAMYPGALPATNEDPTARFADYGAKEKSEWANRWFTEVDRSRSKGIVRAWAFWSARNLKFFLYNHPDSVDDPAVFSAILRSEAVLRWIFDEEDSGVRSQSLPITSTGIREALIAQVQTSPAMRAALCAVPFGALAVARWIDRAPAPDTIVGVSRVTETKGGVSAQAASKFCALFYSAIRPDKIPGSIKETLVAGGVHWEVVKYAGLVYAPIRIPVRKGLDVLDSSVKTAGERAFVTEATERVTQLPALQSMDRAPVLAYNEKAKLPTAFIAKVRETFPSAFFRAEAIPWAGSLGGRQLEVPDLSLSAAQQKTKKGALRQAAREARLRSFPRRVYWPARGFPTDSRSRLFVPPAVATGWPVDPVVHLPAVTSPEEGVKQKVDAVFLAASLETWWARLSEAERASIRVELDLLRPALATSLDGSSEDLAAAPLEPISGPGVPLRHLGVVWVGVTPMDAMGMAHTTRAVELNPQEMPILGMFPMAAHHPGFIGYALVLPAGFGAFGPKATPAVFSSTSKV